MLTRRFGCPPWATHLTLPLDMRYRAGVLAPAFPSRSRAARRLEATSYLGFPDRRDKS